MVIKLALFTCLVYMALAVLIEIVMLLVAHFREGIFVGGKIGFWGSLFAVVWLISFTTAFWFVQFSIRSKLPH